ncbi:AMP-binding, conserved site-containing protein [Cynara cardunculus var. scolymus]|uniref:AMP-binding, conserved site-containing protein n=1 Tax=Cynara cardunculus var. scolymus TaxID=59895 RepID=A0A103XM53_CYNCS|nr:AMP-binding, conserved site-containing protein [Cynara cardunculus var. scolymus]
MSVFTVKVEDSRAAAGETPSAGPVYRCIYAKDGLMELPPGYDSPWDFFSESVKRNPKNPALGRRQIIDGKAGGYSWMSYQDAFNSAIHIASAIRTRSVNPACNSNGITYVPLYDTLGANAVEYIINHAEISLVFVQESKLPAILSCVPNCSSNLKSKTPPLNKSILQVEVYLQVTKVCVFLCEAIVSFGKLSESQKKEAMELGVDCFSWEEFASMGSLEDELPAKHKTDICTIMYTSGTTGEPKGVILSNGAFMSEVLSMHQLLVETDKPDIRYLIEDLLVLKPTIFCGVPRVYDRIYTGIMAKISSGGAVRKALFDYAYYYKLRNLEKGIQQDKSAPLLDKLVFDKIKQGFGGRVRLMLSGAAPLPKHVEEFLRVTCCTVLSQGYGLTESCGGCFTSIANVYSMIGTVGVPMTTIEARLESVPEMGYDALGSVPRGEICLRGTTLFSGYHKREDLSNAVLVDGWFHTGDIGEWQPDGAMKIIDRKKNIFKLSQGEYVAVENIESTYARCPLVTSIWVYGNSFESFLVAVVVPDITVIEEWAVKNNESGDYESLCKNSNARKYVLDELNSEAQKNKLRGFETLKAVHLEPVPFDFERDLITPTFKLKRQQLLKYYKNCVDQLYNEAKTTKK